MPKDTANMHIYSIELQDELKICPLCGYGDGFHSMLKRVGEEIKWLFICPSCHRIFDIGRSL